MSFLVAYFNMLFILIFLSSLIIFSFSFDVSRETSISSFFKLALLLELLDSTVWTLIFANIQVFILGIVISFVTGLLCIKFLLKYLQKHNFKIFMIYRILLAAIIILVLFLR